MEKRNTASKFLGLYFVKYRKKQFFFLILQKKALTALIFYGIISLAELRMNQ